MEEEKPFEPIKLDGSLEVISLGRIAKEGNCAKYNGGRYIIPVGFKSKRNYFSPANLYSEDTVWYSEVIAGDNEAPVFKVYDEEGQYSYQGKSASGPWQELSKLLYSMKKTAGDTSAKHHVALSGPDMFALSHPRISLLIRHMLQEAFDLPNVPPPAIRKRKTSDLKWAGGEEGQVDLFAEDDLMSKKRQRLQRNISTINRFGTDLSSTPVSANQQRPKKGNTVTAKRDSLPRYLTVGLLLDHAVTDYKQSLNFSSGGMYVNTDDGTKDFSLKMLVPIGAHKTVEDLAFEAAARIYGRSGKHIRITKLVDLCTGDALDFGSECSAKLTSQSRCSAEYEIITDPSIVPPSTHFASASKSGTSKGRLRRVIGSVDDGRNNGLDVKVEEEMEVLADAVHGGRAKDGGSVDDGDEGVEEGDVEMSRDSIDMSELT